MKRVISLLILIIVAGSLTGQINKYGVPVIVNFPTQMTNGSEQNWVITQDKFGYIYFGNHDRGVIRYDGTGWQPIQIKKNPRIYSLAADDNGIIYVGAEYEFGYIQPDIKGKPEYISLTDRIDSIPDIKVVFSVVIKDGKANFISPKYLYQYDIQQDKLLEINLTNQKLRDANRLVEINDKLIIADNVEGFFELKDTTITRLPGGEFFSKIFCTVLLPFDESKILVNTFFDGLYLYDYITGDVNSNFIDRKLNETLKIVNVYAAAKLSDDLFAVGTTDQEGILIFNKKGELVNRLVTENSGLESNTILSLYCDHNKSGELWACTQGFISKIYLNIPLSFFSAEQGIEYDVNSVCEFNGDIYLASDVGIYKSGVDKNNNFVFSDLPGVKDQVFPLEVIRVGNSEYLLAGSINGILQISKDGKITKVDNNIVGKPRGEPENYNAKKIIFSSDEAGLAYFGIEPAGLLTLKFDGSRWKFIDRVKEFPGVIGSMVSRKNEGIWFSTEGITSVYNLRYVNGEPLLTQYGSDKGVPDTKLTSVIEIGKDLYLTSSAGLYRYNRENDKFEQDNQVTAGYSEGKYCHILVIDNEGDLWFSGIDGSIVDKLFRLNDNSAEEYSGILKMLPGVPSLDYLFSEGKVYITKSKSLAVLDKSKLLTDSSTVHTYFHSITVGYDSVVIYGQFQKEYTSGRRIPVKTDPSSQIPEFKYDDNSISFEWTTPYFTEEAKTEYSYMLEGFDEGWSEWRGVSFGSNSAAIYSKKEYENIAFGHYKFRVRTRTIYGLQKEELTYEFIIMKPWYMTIVAFVGFALIAFLIVVLIIAEYTKRLKNENIRLEGIVAERTAVVVKQKEELESSIHYASRIQMALLPSDNIISENLKNYFILFKPRDIVSGDFYWMTKKGERLYIVAADCTGHGVPGAFMSLLGMSFLDEIIDKENAPRADQILYHLRLHVTESLKQIGEDDEAKDGMDMALLVIDFDVKSIEFSGAYNPCFRVRKLSTEEVKSYQENGAEPSDGSMSNGKYLLETINASKMPIGISSRMNEDFVFYSWDLEKGVSYYLFSDGYIDQFGGENGRKFMKKNFKKLILEIQDYPMTRQKEILDSKLKEWMGSSPQIDDILVMGIRTE